MVTITISFLALNFFPWEGLRRGLMSVLARLDRFLGYENVGIVAIVPILDAEHHLHNDNRVLGLRAFQGKMMVRTMSSTDSSRARGEKE
jgi:hypothetical protein